MLCLRWHPLATQQTDPRLLSPRQRAAKKRGEGCTGGGIQFSGSGRRPLGEDKSKAESQIEEGEWGETTKNPSFSCGEREIKKEAGGEKETREALFGCLLLLVSPHSTRLLALCFALRNFGLGF